MNTELAKQIEKQRMSVETAMEQIQHFINGFPFLPIVSEVTPTNGLKTLNDDELNHYLHTFPELALEKKIIKFVPASGAASRMFKELFGFLESNEDISQNAAVQKFIQNLPHFAFYKALELVMKVNGLDLALSLENKDYRNIIDHVLTEKGLNYGNLPKGLIQFHQYSDHTRTPVYEHFIEGILYGIGKGNTVRLHFTVSPEHNSKFKEEIFAIQPKLEMQFGVKFEVTFSEQKKSTDTIAVNEDNTPFIEEDGTVLFRPAGHGALLENLNDLDADIIFIKNIDNVVPDRLKETTKDYKIALGGLLLETQSLVFKALEGLKQNISEDSLKFAIEVYQKHLMKKLPQAFTAMDLEQKSKYLFDQLNRPLRVCGMVKNTGEPGGGPFWVKEKDGTSSLQIAETAQINLDDPEQMKILKASTHFNPVDLVCATKDFKGSKFDLLTFRDMSTGFITEKSKSGKVLKAQELPGLWNGSMAGWNTLFVEVPMITFNPVKTVNDLLRAEHQA
jgi:hypothetical protein